MKKVLIFFSILLCFSIVYAQESADDYISKIKECSQKISELELEKTKSKQTRTAELENEKKQKLQDIEKLIQGARERDVAFQERKDNERKTIEENFKTNSKLELEKLDTEYDAKISNEKETQKNLVQILRNKKFVVPDSDTQVSISSFNKNAMPAYWPVTVKSQKSTLNFGYKGNLEIADDESDERFWEIENNKNTATAQIDYMVEVDDTYTKFKKKVIAIRLYLNLKDGEEEKHPVIYRYSNLNMYENSDGFENEQLSEIKKEKNEVTTDVKSTAKTETKANDSVSTKYKEIEVDVTSGGHIACEVLSWIVGASSTIAGTALLPVGLVSDDEAMAIAGGCCLGGGMLLMLAVAMPLSLTHKYETKKEPVSKVQNNPVLKHVSIGFNSIGVTFKF